MFRFGEKATLAVALVGDPTALAYHHPGFGPLSVGGAKAKV